MSLATAVEVERLDVLDTAFCGRRDADNPSKRSVIGSPAVLHFSPTTQQSGIFVEIP